MAAPADEVDPELVNLRRRRRAAGPVLSLCVVILSAVLFARLVGDARFALRGKRPVDIGTATAPTKLEDNTFVILRAAIDLTAPVRMHGQQTTGRRLVPALGTDRRLWIDLEGEARKVRPAYDDVYSGRLRRLRDVGYMRDLAAYIAAAPAEPRVLFPESLKEGLPARDVSGASLAPGPNAPVAVDARSRGVIEILVVKTAEITDQAGAARALTTAGIGAARVVQSQPTAWLFELDSAETPAAILDRLRAARLFSVETREKIARVEGRFGDLVVAGGAITLGGRSLPLDSVERLIVWSPPQLPADAWVLVDGETPATLWYTPILCGALALLGLLMLWSLARGVADLRAKAATDQAPTSTSTQA